MPSSNAAELLWIVPKWPLPANDGARVATRNLLRPLTAAGARVHLCALVPRGEIVDEDAARDDLGVSTTRIVRRDAPGPVGHAKNGLTRPTVPITFAPFAAPDVSREVHAWVAEHDGAPIVLDGLHAGAWTLKLNGRLRRGLPPIYYRAHNVERDLWLRGARDRKNPATKLLLSAQGRLVERFERDMIRRSRAVFPVSDVDRAEFAGWGADTPLVTLPIGFPLPDEPLGPPPDEPRMLFIGRLDWPPNRTGLQWLLDEVWPRASERNPELVLDIVGSGDGAWLEPYRDLPGVRLHGRVPEIPPFYASARASIVPVFFGSGTRVKAIESSMLGRPCISTALGVEGLDLEPGTHYVRAESADEWVEALVSLSAASAHRTGESARARVRTRFDPERIAQRLLETVAAG